MIAYVDCIGGAAGNMLLGALLDAGLDRHALEDGLRSLELGPWQFEVETVTHHGIGALHLEVVGATEDDTERHLAEVERILTRSALPPAVVQQALRTFRRLAEAEAAVHRVDIQEVHFHEVGAVDSILDIAGTHLGLHLLGVSRLECSPLPYGHGTIRCRHGILPNPPPATAHLVAGAPLRPVDVEAELVTPTAAAILTTQAERFGACTLSGWERVGYGAGRRRLPFPNLVRLLIGASPGGELDLESDTVCLLETHVDDASPQIWEHVVERLFESGALDVVLDPVVMKKLRPAVRVTVVGPPHRGRELSQVLLRETPTLGVRHQLVSRWTLPRQMAVVQTPWGEARVKRGGGRVTPEYDDCRRLATASGRPLLEILEHVARQGSETAGSE